MNDVLKHSGLDSEVKVLNIERVEVKYKINNSFQVDTSFIERLHFIEGKPVVFAQASIPPVYGRKIKKWKLEQHTIYELLNAKFNIKVVNAGQAIEAIASSKYISKILRIPEDTPVLRAKRLTYAKYGELVEEIVFYYRHDLLAFNVRLNQAQLVHKK